MHSKKYKLGFLFEIFDKYRNKFIGSFIFLISSGAVFLISYHPDIGLGFVLLVVTIIFIISTLIIQKIYRIKRKQQLNLRPICQNCDHLESVDGLFCCKESRYNRRTRTVIFDGASGCSYTAWDVINILKLKSCPIKRWENEL